MFRFEYKGCESNGEMCSGMIDVIDVNVVVKMLLVCSVMFIFIYFVVGGDSEVVVEMVNFLILKVILDELVIFFW